MPDILAKIARYKRQEVKELKSGFSRYQLENMAQSQPEPRGFLQALQHASATKPALITEIKKASPSKGLIREDFKPSELARAYQDGGATCLSVLTDKPSFQGSDIYLKQARAISTLPVIRKDFMVDPVQVLHARALGADAILIIMAMVDDKLARRLFKMAKDWDMDALIETHNFTEMKRANDLGAKLIGINNRNLKTFKTSLDNFHKLAPHAPHDAFVVAESGINTFDDIEELTKSGARAFLVGESLMRQKDVRLATENLIGSDDERAH
ncbi:MAG TPA: indole-3-glycerol phosphate synthase TrpC [Hellea balneolensis]|uniref:Indole-3-glycerol phosphate synthase n=1 Tax=Hellea balneolensis TaxID=287478 RepID=A0A7C3C555_9PROT|nr:indole-3-glycerol phosphate synthase TrpC [Hellea balneolensis]